MIKKLNLIILIIVAMIFYAGAQNPVSTRTDISYEVSADSLIRNNSPQDLNLSITCESGEDIDAYVLILAGTEALWTVVSAELNDQPLWLIMDEGKAERNDILAWQYDQVEKVLRFYPPPGSNNYDLNMVLQINLLRSNSIQKKSVREVALEAQSAGGLSRCSTIDAGNRIAFK